MWSGGGVEIDAIRVERRVPCYAGRLFGVAPASG